MEPTQPPGGNDMLAEIERAIRALVLPAHVDAIDDTLVAAEKIFYDESMNQKMLADMSQMTVNDPQKVAVGVMGMVTMLRDEQNVPTDDATLAPVASLLTVTMLRFMAESGMLEPDTEFIGNVFEELYALLLQKFGIGHEDLVAMLQEDQAKSQALDPNDPKQLAARLGGGVIDGAMQ